jgi:hypothetical protein
MALPLYEKTFVTGSQQQQTTAATTKQQQHNMPISCTLMMTLHVGFFRNGHKMVLVAVLFLMIHFWSFLSFDLQCMS